MCNMMEHNWQFFDYRKGKSLVTFSFAPFVACFAFLVNGFAKINLSAEGLSQYFLAPRTPQNISIFHPYLNTTSKITA